MPAPTFLLRSLHRATPPPCPVIPTSSALLPPDEIAETLSYALRFDGRRRVHHARRRAERLAWHLRRTGPAVRLHGVLS